MANEQAAPYIENFEQFRQLPTVQKLQVVFEQARGRRRKEVLSNSFLLKVAATEALTRNPRDIHQEGISIVVFGPTDNERCLVVDDPNTMTYPVTVCFPYGAGDQRYFLRTSRFGLTAAEDVATRDELTEVDELVAKNADIKPETSIDRASRLAHSIKVIDSQVKRQSGITNRKGQHNRALGIESSSKRIDILNDKKQETILGYLTTADVAESEYPDAGELYVVSRPQDNPSLRTLEMIIPYSANYLERVLGKEETPRFTDENAYKLLATNLRLEVLKGQFIRRERGSNLHRDIVGHDVYQRVRAIDPTN